MRAWKLVRYSNRSCGACVRDCQVGNVWISFCFMFTFLDFLFTCQLDCSPSLPTEPSSDLRLQCLLLGLQNSSSCCCSWGPYNWAADRSPYLKCYLSKLSQTLKVWWLGHLYELSIVLGTFVFNICPCSIFLCNICLWKICPSLNIMEYLSWYHSMLTKRFVWPKFFLNTTFFYSSFLTK